MRKQLAAAAIVATVLAAAGYAPAQTITTQEDYTAADRAEIAALGQEAHGDLYSLPHDKKMRLVTLLLKYFIRENFVDPASAQAIITNDPHHVDLQVWQGIFGGGNVTYSGMAVCARINGKNRLGGYVGEKQYLVLFMDGAKYRYFWSPSYNEFLRTEETNTTVTSTCGQ